MSAVWTHRGAVVNVALVVIILGTLSLGLVVGLPAESTPPANEEVAGALLRTGLDPQTLAAAGVSSNSIETVVDDARDELVTQIAQLRQADEDYLVAKRDHDRLQSLIRTGQAAGEDLTDCTQAATDMATAESVRSGVLSDVFDAATSSLSSSQVGLINTIKDNRASGRGNGGGAPVEYLAVNRTEQDWVMLRDALANHRISDDLGEDRDATCTDFLASCNADSTVATAAANLSSNLNAVAAQWQASISE